MSLVYLYIVYPYTDEPGVSLFAVHYSVNKPVVGVEAGDYNFDVTSSSGTTLVYIDRNIVKISKCYI